MVLLQQEDYWLSDRIMGFASAVLKSQYQVDGVFDTLKQNGKGKNGFRFVKGNTCQILHINSNHWVLAARRDGIIYLFDSLQVLKHPLCHQVVPHLAMLFCNNEELRTDLIQIPPCQPQTNLTNCGLFAIAFAESFLRGDDPSKSKFQEKMMRYHLYECLFRFGYIMKFP